MDAPSAITFTLTALWTIVLACVAAGAVLYHWPADFAGETRRGFPVLPARAPREAHPDVTAAR